MGYNKRSDKLYEVEVNNETVKIEVPFEKASQIFTMIIESGVAGTDESGEIKIDPIVFFKKFKPIANLVLTKFGPKGEIIEEGDCSLLSQQEVKSLIEVSSDICTSFTVVFFGESEEKSTKSKKKSLAAV